MKTDITRCVLPLLAAVVTTATPCAIAQQAAAQDDPADVRAREVEAQMTDDERFSLIFSLMPFIYPKYERDPRVPADLPGVAGYVPGVPRLGIPPLMMIDASLGLRAIKGPNPEATALPAGLALGSTFNPALARAAGEGLGREARARGFNVALGGGINLVREVRNGRNFEYPSEDPLLSGILGGEMIAGTQAQGVVATIKHFSLHASETSKTVLDAIIDPAAHRESDLLAFEIGIERGQPAAVMTAYNKVNGAYCAGNDALINGVLKQTWGYKGWVMSDWLGVYHWDFALKGLDQHSGAQLDEKEWFNQPLREAVAAGKVPRERISEMVRRMLRSYFAVGIDQWQPNPAAVGEPKIDWEAHGKVALEIARQGMVLLKNDGALPLDPDQKRIALIGGYAHGVVSGDGSSQVMPRGGYAAEIPLRYDPLLNPTTLRLFPSSILNELKKARPEAAIAFDPGAYLADAIALAKKSDVVIFNAIRHEAERWDAPDLTLPFGQDALIAAIAAVNPNVIVVLQTGNPIAMPWLGQAGAVLQAWFPGQAGGQAIAEILTGAVNPSGRLPITFPKDVKQTPFPVLPGSDVPFRTPIRVEYKEGAGVGYRWFAKTGAKSLFAFGHGLSYTTFSHSDLKITGGDTVTATFKVTNTGKREGSDVPQLYLLKAPGEKRLRLLAFERVTLKPGESRQVTLTAEPRLLARFDAGAGRWRIAEGSYQIAIGSDAHTYTQEAEVTLGQRLFGK